MKKKRIKILSFALVIALLSSLTLPVFAASAPQIGHARSSKYKSSDQVSITDVSWFGNDWTIVLRPNSSDLADKMVAVCKAGCANNKILYSQSKRTTLYKEAKKVKYDLSKIKKVCYADCSSFMALCAIAAGVNMDPFPSTATMKRVFVDTGKFSAIGVSDTRYLKKGDILLRPKTNSLTGHTAMVMENGSKASEPTPVSKTNVKWPATKNLKTYCVSNKNNTKVYKTTKSSDGSYGTIYASDLITILSYDSSSGRFYVEYPIKKGTKKGYINKSDVTSGTVNKALSKWTASKKITTYRRSSGNATLGYISKGDVCYTIAESGNRRQIIYPINGGYKVGWINK